MAVIVFLSFWIMVAIGLVFLGIRSGRGPADKTGARGGRTYWYVAFAVIVLGFGVGLPVAASIGNEHNSKDVPEADMTNLTEAQENGRELFGKYCKPATRSRPPTPSPRSAPTWTRCGPTKALVLDAIENGRARGNGAMAANLVRARTRTTSRSSWPLRSAAAKKTKKTAERRRQRRRSRDHRR